MLRTESEIQNISEFRIGNLYWTLIPTEDNIYRLYSNGNLKESIQTTSFTEAKKLASLHITTAITDMLNKIDL